MQLYNAETAYKMAMEGKERIQVTALESFTDIFNEIVTDATEDGETLTIVSLELLGISARNTTPEDFDNLSMFVEHLLNNDYAVEYYYYNPRYHNVSGIIVAWGPDADEQIDEFFATTTGHFYRGEEIGVH